MFPSFPTWSEMHPLVIHFPIALLLIVPLFILLSLIFRANARAFHISALVLLGFGTLSLFVAVQTGESSGEMFEKISAAKATIERHENLAELAQWIFFGLFLVFLGLGLLPTILKKPVSHPVWVGLHSAFLLGYLAGTLILVNTAHEGGKLVHQIGIHPTQAQATVEKQQPRSPGTTARQNPKVSPEESDDDD
ncbi:MAG: hypothetical protein K1Y36_03700 [Blastocatellia bacterium]|nr:hypothetical protein [Blastocatellia bacterium]